MAIAPQNEVSLMPDGDARGAEFKPMAAPAADLSGINKGLNSLNRAYGKALAEADETRVLDLTTKLRRHAIDRQNVFQQLYGENALQPDAEGRSLVDHEMDDLMGFAKDLSKGARLTPEQQKLFDKQVNAIGLSQYGAVSQHVFTQGQAYQASVLKNDQDQAVEEVSKHSADIVEAAAGLQRVEDAARAVAKRSGLGDLAAKRYVENQVGLAVSGAVSRLLVEAEQDESKVYTAKDIFDTFKASLPPDQVLTLSKAVDQSFLRIDSRRVGEDFINRHNPLKGTSPTYNLLQSMRDTRGKSDAEVLAMSRSLMKGSVIEQESAGQHFTKDKNGRLVPKRSPKGAIGVAQLTYDAAKDVYKRVYGRELTQADWASIADDPKRNEEVGTQYLNLMLKDFGNVEQALAAYNAGPGAVKAALKEYGANWLVHMPAETRKYVPEVMDRYEKRSSLSALQGKGSGLTASSFREAYQPMSEDEIRKQLLAEQPELQYSKERLDSYVNAASVYQTRTSTSWTTEMTNIATTLMDGYAKTGSVNMELYNKLPLASQKAFDDWKTARDKGDTSGDQVLRDQILYDTDAWFGEKFKRGLTIDQADAEVRGEIMTLPKADQDDVAKAWSKYQVGVQRGITDAERRQAAVQAGVVNREWCNANREQIESFLNKEFDKDYKNLDPESKRGIYNAAADRIAAYGQLSGVQIKGNSWEFESLMASALKDFDVHRMILPNTKKSIFLVDPEDDLPGGAEDSPREIIRELAKRRMPPDQQGTRNPSNGEMREVLIGLFTNPKAIDISDSMSATKWDAVRDQMRAISMDAYKRKYNTLRGYTEPDNRTLLCDWLAYEMAGGRLRTPDRPSASMLSNTNDYVSEDR